MMISLGFKVFDDKILLWCATIEEIGEWGPGRGNEVAYCRESKHNHWGMAGPYTRQYIVCLGVSFEMALGVI